MTPTRQPRVFAILIVLCLALSACARSDAQIKAEADTVVAGTPGATVTVTGGVVTMSGQVADDAAKSAAVASLKGVKGVKSVVDNATVAPPVVISADELLRAGVAAVLKDISTLQADVNDGVITLTGEIQRSALPALMQALSALQPKKIDNKATVKR